MNHESQLDHNTVITQLQEKIKQALAPLIADNEPVALLDYPNHSNVGDSAIWLGEIAYLREMRNIAPSYVCDIPAFDANALRNAMPKGILLIHGGGNFGDIWPSHQRFREMLLEQFKDYKIIQLPQSLHFNSSEEIENSKQYINSHPDFTLMVRDQPSYDFAKQHYDCHIVLCPDMAFCMGVQTSSVVTTHDVSALMRTDSEKVEGASNLHGSHPFSYVAEDWLHEDQDVYKKQKYITMLQLPFVLKGKALDKNRQRELLYNNLAATRVRRGLNMLARGKYVLTDRLHGHILSLLLKKPHIRLDNYYGKVSNFAQAWTAETKDIWPASNMNEAIEIIKCQLKSQ
ncbi:MAG: polysaccharide pyruvyl transferase family protein [Alphaproteobacteria bacterium]|nr:polysaccharide pyruvyl transferase family protein [Alphaproteobacteria bacterium]